MQGPLLLCFSQRLFVLGGKNELHLLVLLFSFSSIDPDFSHLFIHNNLSVHKANRNDVNFCCSCNADKQPN